MSNVLNIHSLQELYRYLNEKNVLEVVVRGNNKQIRAIQNYLEESIREIEAYIQTVQDVRQDILPLNRFFLEELGM